MSKHLLVSKAGVYYFRMKIPKDLQQYFMDKSHGWRLAYEFKKTLKTRNLKTAENIARLYAAQVGEVFSTLMRSLMPDSPIFTTIKIAGFERKSDGSFKIDSVETDPDKPESENSTLNNFMQQLAALPVFAAKHTVVAPPESVVLSRLPDWARNYRSVSLRGAILQHWHARCPAVVPYGTVIISKPCSPPCPHHALDALPRLLALAADQTSQLLNVADSHPPSRWALRPSAST